MDDERTFTAKQIAAALDKLRNEAAIARDRGVITREEELQQGSALAGVASELGIFAVYAFWPPEEKAN
jgi:hypothetical protein